MKLRDKRILLVEDNPDQQRLYLKYLLDQGADVTLECNGYSAARMTRKADLVGNPYHAVIMDLYLYQSDGMEATREILKFNRSMVIIAITASANPDIERQWKAAGCSAFLTKPIPPNTLIDAILTGIENGSDKEKRSESDRICSPNVARLSESALQS